MSIFQDGTDAACPRRFRVRACGVLSSLGVIACCATAAAQQAPAQQPPPATIQLPTIEVVSPTLIATPQSQIASSVTVITSDQLERDQRRTVPDALATVPGLNIVQTGGPMGETDVFMRGTNPNHVKVLVDGIDVSDPSSPSASFDFSQLVTGDIERIEVLRGPQAGLYGSDAIGGVISVTTKQGSGPPKVTASVEGGSYGTTREQVGLSGSEGDFSYAFNVQHFQAISVPVTPLDLLAPGEQRNNDFSDNWTYSTKLGKRLSDTLAVNVIARYSESKLRFTGEDCENFVPCAPEVLQSTQVTRQLFTRAEAVWSPVDTIKNYFGVNYTNEYTWFNDPNADSFLTSPLVTPPSTTVGTRLEEDYRGEVQVAPGQLVMFGAQHQNETLRTDSTDSVDQNGNATFFTTYAERRSDAGWLQLQNQITKDFSLVSNVRYDDYDTFGGHTTWRIAPVYVIPDTGTKLKATYGTGFKAPSLSDLYVNFPGAPSFVGNPNLKPEESQGWDVGFEQPVAQDRFRFGVTFFHNDVTNLINIGQESANVFTNVNVGHATMYGVESFASWKVTNNFDLRADYTNTTAKDDSDGQQLVRRPKNKASVTAAWQATDRLSLSATVLYVGSWLDLDRSGVLFPCSGGLPCLDASPFTTVNLAANYKASDNISYFMRIDNLFNQQYENPIGFLRPGIGIYGGVRLTGLPASGDAGLAFVPPFLRDDRGVPTPVYKAPPPAFSWTGLYGGANVGYGWSPFSDQLQDLSNGPGNQFGGLSPNGAFGGVQTGGNWQWPGSSIVIGGEADFQGSAIKDSQTWTLATSSSQVTNFGTLRGRAGYAYDQWLFYGTGGFAYGHVNNSELGGVVYTTSHEAGGWVAGGGIEWAFAPKWSLKGEYQYINLGQSVPVAAGGGAPLTAFPGVTVHADAFSTVRLGINYKF